MSYRIEMIRGTTSTQLIKLLEDNQPYLLSENEFIHFGVKEAGYSSRLLISKKFTRQDQDEEGNIEFKITPNETINWPVKTYKYDIGLQSGDDYFIIIPESLFVVRQTISHYLEE